MEEGCLYDLNPISNLQGDPNYGRWRVSYTMMLLEEIVEITYVFSFKKMCIHVVETDLQQQVSLRRTFSCVMSRVVVSVVRTQEIARQTIVPFKKKCFGEAIDKGFTSFTHVIQTILGNPNSKEKERLSMRSRGTFYCLLPVKNGHRVSQQIYQMLCASQCLY